MTAKQAMGRNQSGGTRQTVPQPTKDASQAATHPPVGALLAMNPATVLQLQRATGNRATTSHLRRNQREPAAPPSNATGISDSLKAGVEQLAGVSLDDVRVHTHSPAPARLDADAYTQGTQIHLGPGQEHYLAHEAWHVTQQKQGRVASTVGSASVPLNDDQQLEHEAETMGAQASAALPHAQEALPVAAVASPGPNAPNVSQPIQLGKGDARKRAAAALERDKVQFRQELIAATDFDAKYAELWQANIGDRKRLDALKAIKQVEGTPAKKLQRAITAQQIDKVMAILTQATASEFTPLVKLFTAASTRWFLENMTLPLSPAQDQVVQKFKAERAVEGALSIKDKLYWAGGSGPDPNDGYKIKTTTQRPKKDDLMSLETNTNEFAAWMRGGAEPSAASKMNCWEAVLYGAYLGGVVTKKWLQDIHTEAAAAGAAATSGASYMAVLAKHMGLPSAQQITAANKPKRGDIIFMNGMSHVALSLGTKDSAGNHEIMSLWILPMDGLQLGNGFKKTTIEAIDQDWQGAPFNKAAFNVTFAPNPF